MTNLIHPLATTTTSNLRTNRHICSFLDQIVTGKKNIGSVVDYIIGSKNEDQAIILGSISKGIRQGQRQLLDTQLLLASVKGQLNDLRTIVDQASNSQGIRLMQLDSLYSTGITKIIGEIR